MRIVLARTSLFPVLRDVFKGRILKWVGAAYTFLGLYDLLGSQVFPATWPLPHLRDIGVRVPLWGWLLGAVLILAIAFLQHALHLHAKQIVIAAPLAELHVEPKDILFHAIWVKNIGAPARFRAELRITKTNARYYGGGSEGPLWFETEKSISAWLPSGASDWILLARRDLLTLFRWNATVGSTYVLLQFSDFPAESDQRFIEFEVCVMSEPPMGDGALTKRFRYSGGLTDTKVEAL